MCVLNNQRRYESVQKFHRLFNVASPDELKAECRE